MVKKKRKMKIKNKMKLKLRLKVNMKMEKTPKRKMKMKKSGIKCKFSRGCLGVDETVVEVTSATKSLKNCPVTISIFLRKLEHS